MASITDCVVEGLKYPFNDLKKLLGFGVLFAILSALSTYISVKSFDIFRFTVHLVENTNTTVSHIGFSQLPTGDIYLVVGLAILSFIVTLFIFGYQYDIVKFSIDKKSVKRWHEAGLHTAEQVRAGDAKVQPKQERRDLDTDELDAIKRLMQEG